MPSCPVEDRHCFCSHTGFIDPLKFFPVCEGVSFNSAVSLCVLSRCGFGVCRPETERSDHVSARKKRAVLIAWRSPTHTGKYSHTHTNQKSKPSFTASVCEVCLPSAIDFSLRNMALSSAGSLTPAGSESHRPDSDFDWCASDGFWLLQVLADFSGFLSFSSVVNVWSFPPHKLWWWCSLTRSKDTNH